MKKLIAFLLFIQIIYAEEVYQYKDNNGNLVVTNQAIPNAQKMDLPPLNVLAKPMTKQDFIGKSKNTKIQQSNLGTNEVGRQKILQEELNREQAALVDAQKLVEENNQIKIGKDKKSQEASKERSKALNDAVIEHQKNIAILNKQLGN